ncbi:MAG: Hsp20/alpha crystallin family protein [Acidimicrobiia bacterium]|nr:Hsp20/alpha crystallin family protein [Acidimicrobiia bacterium]
MLLRFEQDLDRLTRELFRTGRTDVMPVDAYRKDDRFYMHFDIPGIDPDSIDITIEKNSMNVSVERTWAAPQDANLVLNERPQGAFSRRFFLGEGLDTEQIEAGYDHGVLTISIPVAEQAKPRKITVGAAEHAALTS